MPEWTTKTKSASTILARPFSSSRRALCCSRCGICIFPQTHLHAAKHHMAPEHRFLRAPRHATLHMQQQALHSIRRRSGHKVRQKGAHFSDPDGESIHTTQLHFQSCKFKEEGGMCMLDVARLRHPTDSALVVVRCIACDVHRLASRLECSNTCSSNESVHFGVEKLYASYFLLVGVRQYLVDF